MRGYVLTLASIVFYAVGEWAFLPWLVASTAASYYIAIGLDRWRGTRAARVLLVVGIALDLALLVVFKYAAFITTNVNELLGLAGLHALPVPSIALPLGISIFTFHKISDKIDIARNVAEVRRNPSSYFSTSRCFRSSWLQLGLSTSPHVIVGKDVVVVAPDKQTIYSDLMPRWTQPLALPSRLDQLVALFGSRNDIAFVDLRPAMAEARRAGIPFYRRTDTHWNDFGAFVASRELHRTLTHWFPTVTVPENAGALVRYLPLGGYLARFLGLQAHLSDEEVLPLVVQQHASFEYQNGALQSSSTRPGAPIRRGYVLHDSFKSAMASYLSETFETVAYYWTTRLDVAHMQRFAPDVVIIEIAERFLMLPPSQIAAGK